MKYFSTFLAIISLSCSCVAVEYSKLDRYDAYIKNRVGVPEGHTGSVHRKFFNDLLDKNPWVRLVAETGFNAGHSAEVFLSARPDIHVVSFDIGHYTCVQVGFSYLNSKYPGRLNLVIGNSKVTVPEYVAKNQNNAKFDLVFVDGGHDAETAYADIVNMRDLTHTNTLLIVDDYNMEGVESAFDQAVKDGIVQLIRIHHDQGAPDRALAKYNHPVSFN